MGYLKSAQELREQYNNTISPKVEKALADIIEEHAKNGFQSILVSPGSFIYDYYEENPKFGPFIKSLGYELYYYGKNDSLVISWEN